MGKLKLNLDEIKVESFEVIYGLKTSGTVLAQETGDCPTPLDQCDPTYLPTCYETCQTCAYTCPNTCLIPTEEAACVTPLCANTELEATCTCP